MCVDRRRWKTARAECESAQGKCELYVRFVIGEIEASAQRGPL